MYIYIGNVAKTIVILSQINNYNNNNNNSNNNSRIKSKNK